MQEKFDGDTDVDCVALGVDHDEGWGVLGGSVFCEVHCDGID